MNDIHIFIIDQGFKTDTVATANGFEYCVDAIHRQAKSLGISYELDVVNKNELPTKVSSKMVSVFMDNTMINNRYLLSAISINNLYPKFSLMSGEISTLFTSFPDDIFLTKVMDYFKCYKIGHIESNLICDISKEKQNLPPAYNITINSSVYNQYGGYSFIETPRGSTTDNIEFISNSAKLGNAIYFNGLSTKTIYKSEDISIKLACRYFYNLGYLAALRTKSEDEPQYERVWKQFVESPECLDHRIMGRLIFDNTIPEQYKRQYSESVAMIRCSYQCGMLEGLSGVTIL